MTNVDKIIKKCKQQLVRQATHHELCAGSSEAQANQLLLAAAGHRAEAAKADKFIQAVGE